MKIKDVETRLEECMICLYRYSNVVDLCLGVQIKSPAIRYYVTVLGSDVFQPRAQTCKNQAVGCCDSLVHQTVHPIMPGVTNALVTGMATWY